MDTEIISTGGWRKNKFVQLNITTHWHFNESPGHQSNNNA